MNKQQVIQRIPGYIEMLNVLGSPEHTFHVTLGRTYAKILHSDNSVHSFIDMSNGDILKAASWDSPERTGKTKGVRGNIFSEDFGQSKVTKYGTAYLR